MYGIIYPNPFGQEYTIPVRLTREIPENAISGILVQYRIESAKSFLLAQKSFELR